MNKRSFVRGFGSGVLFATLILGASCLIRTSDAAVVRRARQLGMEYVSEEEPLFPRSDAASTGAVSTHDPADPSQAPAAKKTKEKKNGKETPKPPEKLREEETDRSELEKDRSELEKEKKKKKEEFEEREKEFTIQEGEWSADVSGKLEKSGIISDASAFNDYLERNGYGGRIRAGTFSISMDSTYEEIAKEIVGQ